MATDLCHEHGFDPGKELPPIVCPTCERDLIYIWGIEDEMIILNKEGTWHETLYASCPEQAKGFYEYLKNDSYRSIEEWRAALDDFQSGWESAEEDYD